MPILLQSNHALSFDGVTDGVIMPQGTHSKLGYEHDATNSNLRNVGDIVGGSSKGGKGKSIITGLFPTKIAIEAWVVPDCGGVIISKEGQFQLSIGTVDTPGPATFEAFIQTPTGQEKVFLRSALPTATGYDGQVYPPFTYGGIDDSYNRFAGSKDDATSLNINQRPLYHIVASFENNIAKLYINGDLVCKQTINKDYTLIENSNHIYLGGKGGEFRGVIESIHITTGVSKQMIDRSAPLVENSTVALFRFEEPISPFSDTYTITATPEPHGASSYNDGGLDSAITQLSTITVSTTDAQAIANALTGKTITSSYVDFTVSPYSTGNYTVVDRATTPGTESKRTIPHVPYNLLINPSAINQDTKKPNQKPPERVRLHRINITSGEMLISSIHLDFINSNYTAMLGLRGLLHTTHISANGANSFVIISSDLLIENGTGMPYQPPHLSTQLLDRTGQMLIDESVFEQHAMVYSSKMATTSNSPNNPFAVDWPSTLNESFQIGHSGRHTLNHVEGHHYLRSMPRANEETLDQQSGNADILTLMYDETTNGVSKQFPMNSVVDYYRELARFEIRKSKNSSLVYEAVTNGLADPNKKLISIGGASGDGKFDPRPFVLKGPVPDKVAYTDVDANTRKFHLRPSSKSRVALLHVPELSSYNLAPYVEIHYNAIDFTGVSMGKTHPMLMVEKTVPESNLLLESGIYLIDKIENAISSGKTLYSPGGFIEVGIPEEGGLGQRSFQHGLIGDNSEGFESDEELDETYTPQNYTPLAAGTEGNSPPLNVNASHTTKAEHDSVFHRLLIERVTSGNNLATSGVAVQTPYTDVASPSAGEFDSAQTSGGSPIHEMFDIIDNHNLFFQDGSIHRLFIQPSDRRRTNQLQYIKTRLERGDDANRVSLFYVMTRARLRSIEEVESEDSGRYSVVNCVGLTDVALTRSVSEIGSGSPDSHVVKEIDANAPVVSVTLGGVGQGAYDTKPTFDPSPLSRLPYSTRRGFSCTASSIRIDLGGTPIQFIEVTPLNNNSDDLKNWGTYPFPKVGRIYLKDGASAEYTSKTGVSFHFSDNADLSKKLFTLADGSSVATFKEWSIQTGLCSAASTVTGSNNGTFDLGDTIMGDGFFFIENASTDGTTVNDRLFQSMDNVTHDYQLGSQFASTRALVEIPLFKEQIFEDAVKNIYPSPDNSLKLHLDATLTPHTWNPSPVGRRYPSQPPADRSAYSSNASSKLKNKNQKHTKIKGWEHIPSEVVRTATAGTTDITVGQEIKATSSSGNGVGMIIKVITVSSGDIDSAEVINTGLGYAVGDTVVFTANGGGNNTLKIHVLGHYRIYPSNPKMFPAAVTTGASYYSATDILIHRQAFLSTGDWMIYSNTPSDDNYLKIDDNTSNYSIDLFSNMVAGMQIILGGDYQSEVLLPLTGDPVTPSAVNEFRREYHHDAASALTQGGNVDYGLRQYVSAVEFKAGPTANPHIPKIQSGRAKGTVLAVNAFSNTGLASIVLSREDLEKFPKIKPNLQDGTTLVYDIGDYHYTIEVTDPSGTSHRLIYLGESDDFALPYLTGSPSSRKHSSSILVQTVDITHTGIPTIFDKTNAAYIAGQEIKLAKRGFDVEFTDGDKTLADLQTNLNLSNSGRVRHAQYHWEVLELGAAAKKTLKVQIGQINSASSSGWRRLLQANSLEVSVNLGDHVYAEVSTYTGATPTNQCYYLGEVIKVYEGILEEGKGINAKSSETIIELKEEIPSATITALNSDISSITTLANGSAPANKYAHIYLRVGCHSIMKNDDDAILNRTWLYPYAGGGLRHGDTVWANMTYNNPHAMQGMFAKSRGVFNEALVWEEFNDGEGILNNQPRDSIPIENFLIGNTCLETAQNYAQHVNKTIELNYTNLGLDNPPTIAYVDPYLCSEEHARVLLYDVAHDREFIAFQDLHMQVQTDSKVAEIGWNRYFSTENKHDGGNLIDLGKYAISYNGGGNNAFMTQIDVANGFPTQNKYIRKTEKSNFMESAYAHNIANQISTDLLNPVAGTVLSLEDFVPPRRGSGYSAATHTGIATTLGGGTGLTVTFTAGSNGALAGIPTIAAGGTGYKNGATIRVAAVSSAGQSAYFKVRTVPTGVKASTHLLTSGVKYGKGHGHFVHTGYYTGGMFSEDRALGDSILSRVADSSVLPYWSNKKHELTRQLFSSENYFARVLMQFRETSRATFSVVVGGDNYFQLSSGVTTGKMFGVRTTTSGLGSGLLLDVTITSGAIAAATISQSSPRQHKSLSEMGYKDGDLIYVQDTTTVQSITSSSTVQNRSGTFVEAILRYNDVGTFRETATTFDTPDGTRVIPAFLASKGIRSSTLNLTNMNETRLQHLPHWTQMDFTRRLSIDLGEIALRDGVTNIESAANEVVRLINQAGAKNGRTHIRRPNQDYPGESKILGLSNVGIKHDDNNQDASSPHISADFSATGSTFDPAVWWDEDKSFDSYDKGSHMGYLRAHIGRVVQDTQGNEGYSIIIHSTIPGATGRNFCVWLDNSRGQSPYQPEFMIGHGGRFRTFWCQPDEMSGENMHPAPMPLNKHGRPFAPVTSLRQYTQPTDSIQQVTSVGEFSNNDDTTSNAKMRAISMMSGSGQNMNTVNTESLESQGFITSYTEGLRTGSSATSRINFGGLVASGVPGFAPDAGKWGFGRKGDSRFNSYYGSLIDSTSNFNTVPTSYSSHINPVDIYPDNIGNSNLYGFKFVDHRGKSHCIRFVYRKFGEKFALDNTELPETIEDEVLVYIDDRDVSQGGFTIGHHMQNMGDVTNGFPVKPINSEIVAWRGNKWNCIKGENAGYLGVFNYDSTNNTMTVVLDSPYDTSNCDHPDVLGYMGFPKTNGVFQLSDVGNDAGILDAGTLSGTPDTTNTLAVEKSVTGGSGSGMKIEYISNGSAISGLAITDMGDGKYENGDALSFVPTGATSQALTLTFSMRGSQGHTFSYEYRTRNAALGTGASNIHTFYGVKGDGFIASHTATTLAANITGPTASANHACDFGDGSSKMLGVITSAINWTCLLTDELMANVIDYVINLNDVNNKDGYTFDCSEMYASDGRTFAEWGVSPDAIRIRAYNPDRKIEALSNFFTSTLHRDEGITSAHVDFGEVEKVTLTDDAGISLGNYRGISDSLIDDGYTISAGYIPKTVLQITTKSKGSNANTSSPILVDSQNNIVDTSSWLKCLTGEDFISLSGDKITPNCDNPTMVTNIYNSANTVILTGTGASFNTSEIWNMAMPAQNYRNNWPTNGSNVYDIVNGFGDTIPITLGKATGTATSHLTSVLLPKESLKLVSKDDNWPSNDYLHPGVLQKYNDKRCRLFAGKRSLGSVLSTPIIYFRGGQDSPDNYVPLFFGGGFSGAIIDINDGTQKDYSSFNTHPYANGPSGCAGIQHANEILSSFATLDCNAIMAFFPGTALLNNHRGSINPPTFNYNNLLSPDIKKGGQAVNADHPFAAPYSAGVDIQVPSPMILRFAHPTARYHDSQPIVDATCDYNNDATITMNSTTHLVVGMSVTGTGIPLGATVASITNATTFELSVATTGGAVTNGTLTFNYIENKTTYLIYGPGQAFPLTHEVADPINTFEPHPGKALLLGNSKTKLPIRSTHTTAFLPNHIDNDQGHYMPMTSAYQLARHRYHWRQTLNWTTAAGKPNVALLGQRPESGDYYGEQFTSGYKIINETTSSVTDADAQELRTVQPNRHSMFMGMGQIRSSDLCFHMDGGYHPGGSWMDNQLTFNPPHPTDNVRVTLDTDRSRLNATAFRVAGPMAKKVMYGSSGSFAADTITKEEIDTEYIVVDATRCQNGEELACVLGAAINTFPGKGALKSLGGTFMPSMGNALRQDKYGWIPAVITSFNASSEDASKDINLNKVDLDSYTKSTASWAGGASAYGHSNMDALGAAPASTAGASTGGWADCFIDLDVAGSDIDSSWDGSSDFIPESGWLRCPTVTGATMTRNGGTTTTAIFAPYHSRIKFKNETSGHNFVRFFIAPNKLTGRYVLESPETWYDYLYDGGTNVQNRNAANIPTQATGLAPGGVIYIWSKSGVHEWNNEVDANRTHMCRPHFSGLVDAIDRTKPKGVAGWHGERYSYLNSLGITPAGGSKSYAAGLGAWFPKLGFSPYGGSTSCASILGNYAHITPMPNSPENVPPTDSQGSALVDLPTDDNSQHAPHNLHHGGDIWSGSANYETAHADGGQYNSAPLPSTMPEIRKELLNAQGTYARSLLVVAYEGELALVAKKDRDGITCVGDYLKVGQTGTDTQAGTTQWDERFHDQDRFVCTANAGPNIEALIATGTDASQGATATFNYTASNALDASPFDAELVFHGNITADSQLENATPCRAKTGDLFYDYDKNIGGAFHESASSLMNRNVPSDYISSVNTPASASFGGGTASLQKNTFWIGDVHAYNIYRRAPFKNFNIENIVWKRMDGGSLTLPTSNARGLGAIPWITRVKDAVVGGATGSSHLAGEKLLGNIRFSFETTNSAMMPILQAQEISHPQLAAKHPIELKNVLEIPNEEIQFEDITVIDDTGQTHTLEGGSPLGVIIRGFKSVGERIADGLQPIPANSSVAPNLEIQLPDPDNIPGNIIIRSGFDKIQAYQNETAGDGGMIHPDLGESQLGHLFDNVVKGPRLTPTMNETGWEHIARGADFPNSTKDGWKDVNNNNSLKSSYEQHDRTLFFHITKMGNSHTEKYLTTYTHSAGVVNTPSLATNFSGTTLTTGGTITSYLYDANFGSKERLGKRRFLRLDGETSGDSVVVSYTGISGATFTGVIGDIDFDQFLIDNPLSSGGVTISPSYYIPAGSTRIFAARRLRDHSEVSGNSPDMAHTEYFSGNQNTLLHTRYSNPQLTPMPYPRMGHHYVNATMPMMPGHWAHPAYQGLYDRHRNDAKSLLKDEDYITYENYLAEVSGTDSSNTQTTIGDAIQDRLHPLNPSIRVGTQTASPSGPSDIHGGGFTLMFETKIKYDGYGILASKGKAGVINKSGGHSIVLEAGANYTLDNHFPDPAEVGAYQIIIQPNLRKEQIAGFHRNNADATGLPTAGTSAVELTSQQVNLVIGVKYDAERHASLNNALNRGGLTLILAEATLADVRGCEIFINEVILDHDPDHMSQFTNIPPMLLYNSLGVQGSESPAFTRTSHPYHSGMFVDATPGYTLNIPWWSIMHKIGPNDASSTGFRHLSIYRIDNYYEFCRGTHGSVAAQITLGGYPTIYPDIYSSVLGNVSLNPSCIVQSGSSGTTINVDDASLFPSIPYYGEKLAYISPTTGAVVTLAYTQRVGTEQAYANLNKYHQILIPSGTLPPTGVTLFLTRPYSDNMRSDLFNKSASSVFTRILPQLHSGTRDTNSLFVGDAYLCAWHPNLGRPYTYYSDASRTFGGSANDRAINKAAYNNMPQHYETIHYHDVNYAASHGPMHFAMKTPKPPAKISQVLGSTTSNTLVFSTDIRTQFDTNDFLFTDGTLIGKVASEAFGGGNTTITCSTNLLYTPANGVNIYKVADGSTATGAAIHAMNSYEGQGSNSVMLSHYWPSGSRGGPLVSRLDGYAATAAGWGRPRNYTAGTPVYWEDDDDDGSYAVASGVSAAASVGNIRPFPFGYRFGLRQTWNRPQWGLFGARGILDYLLHSTGTTNLTVGYKAGPIVEYESQTWTYAGGVSGTSNPTMPTTYVGMLERHTTAAGMIGMDKYDFQVKYSEGRRITRPFGCPLRTLVNASTVIRDWWGDDNGKGLFEFGDIVGYYLVDWWGNTRGEDIRRAPVRGFGINPAWDAGDAYEYDRINNRTPHLRIWNNGKPLFNVKGVLDASGDVSVSGTTIPRFGGRQNTGNNGEAGDLVDVFSPTNALRVGDMGSGRGVRYPTQFNEDVLIELSDVYESSGVVLSHNTAEPTFGTGYIRPRNDILQNTEVKRGISSRLEIDEDGLLKPEAIVSDRVENISGTSVHKEAISRSSPRIGVDGESLESFANGDNKDMVAINTEAHSLHSDKGVGQRTILQGGMQAGSQTLAHYDLTSLSFAAQPHGGVMRFSHTNNMKNYGGVYVVESKSYISPFNDSGWGRGSLSSSQKTSNPYETNVYDSSSSQTNFTDNSVKFLLKPTRVLDNKHVEVFRPLNNLDSGAEQYAGDYFSATAGGKYGLFVYEVENGRAGAHTGSTGYVTAGNPNTNAPYQPVYLMETSSDTVPVSKGPKLLGTEVTGYDKNTLKSHVTRLIISENTLQYYRSDAPRRLNNKSKDYTVQPRFSQSLHAKGHKGDVNFNTSSHNGDS